MKKNLFLIAVFCFLARESSAALYYNEEILHFCVKLHPEFENFHAEKRFFYQNKAKIPAFASKVIVYNQQNQNNDNSQNNEHDQGNNQ